MHDCGPPKIAKENSTLLELVEFIFQDDEYISRSTCFVSKLKKLVAAVQAAKTFKDANEMLCSFVYTHINDQSFHTGGMCANGTTDVGDADAFIIESVKQFMDRD